MLLNVALSTIERLEPIATEIEALTEIENHQDTKITSGHGLPLFAYFNIGKNALNRVHLNMIKRLYGEFGDEVLMVSYCCYCYCYCRFCCACIHDVMSIKLELEC